jgi:hypothetical protein
MKQNIKQGNLAFIFSFHPYNLQPNGKVRDQKVKSMPLKGFFPPRRTTK